MTAFSFGLKFLSLSLTHTLTHLCSCPYKTNSSEPRSWWSPWQRWIRKEAACYFFLKSVFVKDLQRWN